MKTKQEKKLLIYPKSISIQIKINNPNKYLILVSLILIHSSFDTK